MADPSIDPAVQATDIDSALTNGTAQSEQQQQQPQQPADVEMADSNPISQQSSTETPLPPPTTDATLQPTVQTQPPTPSQPQPQPAPASSRNSPHPTAQAPPTQPIPHGSPTRVYLNQHVTPHLLEAMKHLATNEPDKPLKWLSEFLARKSAEIEG